MAELHGGWRRKVLRRILRTFRRRHAQGERTRGRRIRLRPGRKWLKRLGRTIALPFVHGPEHAGAPRSVCDAVTRLTRGRRFLVRPRMIVVARDTNCACVSSSYTLV